MPAPRGRRGQTETIPTDADQAAVIADIVSRNDYLDDSSHLNIIAPAIDSINKIKVDLDTINEAPELYGNTMKILPQHFMCNDDASAYDRMVIYDTSGIALKVGNRNCEVYAMISIPEGMKLVNVRIYASDSRLPVTIYNVDLRGGQKWPVMSGTAASAIDLTNNRGSDVSISSTATNYVAIQIATSATNQYIYGGSVELSKI